MFKTTDEIYDFTTMTIERCRDNGFPEIAQQLEDAMHLGSSGLEILGAIKTIFHSELEILEDFVDREKLLATIDFANRSFGTE